MQPRRPRATPACSHFPFPFPAGFFTSPSIRYPPVSAQRHRNSPPRGVVPRRATQTHPLSVTRASASFIYPRTTPSSKHNYVSCQRTLRSTTLRNIRRRRVVVDGARCLLTASLDYHAPSSRATPCLAFVYSRDDRSELSGCFNAFARIFSVLCNILFLL